MFAKILSAAFIASILTSAACAAQRKLTEVQYSLVLDGIIWHGSTVCDEAWLERAGSKKIAQLAHDALNGGISDKEGKKLLGRGMKDFHNDLHNFGKTKACQRLDQLIDNAAE